MSWKIAGWLLLAILILAALAVIYLILRRIGMQRLSYRRYFTQPGVFEGESVYLIEEVGNAFIMPLFFVDVEAFIYADLKLQAAGAAEDKTMQHFCSRFFLLPFTKTRRKHPVQCLSRGYYQLESVRINSGADFIHLDSPAAIYVYPRTLPVEESAALNREIQNNCLALHTVIEDPFSFSGVREYRRGDPFGRINFKATAKTGILKVNELDPLSNRNFMVYINYQVDSDKVELEAGDYERLMEQALSHAAYLTQRAVEQGYKTGFAVNAKTADGEYAIRLPRRSGSTHYEDILCGMAKVKNRAGVSFCSIIEKDLAEGLEGAEIFVYTLYIDARISEVIEKMRRMGNLVMVHLLLPKGEKP